MSDVCNSRALT